MMLVVGEVVEWCCGVGREIERPGCRLLLFLRSSKTKPRVSAAKGECIPEQTVVYVWGW